MNFLADFSRLAKQDPRRPALSSGGESFMTYGRLD